MRKLGQIISAVVLGTALVATTAGAQKACDWTFDIHNSGDGNNTTIVCNDVQNVTFECVNNVVVGNISYQDGKTGPATVGGNGSNGSATTGTVTNSNNVSTQVGVACGETPSPSPTPTTSPSPSASPSPAPVKPAALPYTAGSSTESIVIASLASAAIIVLLSRVAVAAYHRFGNK